MSDKKINVSVIDDHQLVREGIVKIVNDIPEFVVTIVASNGKELLQELRSNEAPAIALVDIHMPEMDGYETVETLKREYPEIRCISLTLDNSEEAITRTIRAGARAYLRKNCSPRLLRATMNVVQEFGYCQTEEVHNAMVSNPGLRTKSEREREGIAERITPREMEFLKLVCDAKEFTYDQISAQMDISRRTVDHYRTELFEKFEIKSKAGLVLFAYRWKLVEPLG